MEVFASESKEAFVQSNSSSQKKTTSTTDGEEYISLFEAIPLLAGEKVLRETLYKYGYFEKSPVVLWLPFSFFGVTFPSAISRVFWGFTPPCFPAIGH